MKLCLYCNNPIIDPEEKRRFRKDKKFCNQKCHDAHKYKNNSKEVNKFREDFGLNKYTYKGLKKKLILIELMGGKCERCGYNKNISGLDFHHKDGYIKNFEIKIQYLNWRTDDEIIEEAIKCMLLCANCHREIHNPHLEINHVKRVIDTLDNK